MNTESNCATYEVITIDDQWANIFNIVIPQGKLCDVSLRFDAKYLSGTGGSSGDNYKSIVENQFVNITGTIDSPYTAVSLYENATQLSGGFAVWKTRFVIADGNLIGQVRGAANNRIIWTVELKTKLI